MGDDDGNRDNAMKAVNPNATRKCTDLLCLALFIAFWGGMIAVVVNGFTRGDPDRLIYGLDYKFDQCNRDNSATARGVDSLTANITSADGETSKTITFGGRDHSSSPFYYVLGQGPPTWPSSAYIGVCASECANLGGSEIGFKPDDWVCTGKYYAKSNRPSLSSDSLPKITEFTKSAVENFVSDIEALSSSGALADQADYLKSFFLIKDSAKCADTAANDADECSVCFPAYPSVAYGGAFCLPDPEWVQDNADRVMAVFGKAYDLAFVQEAAKQIFGDGGDVTMRVLSDAYRAMPVVLGCIGFSVVLGFVWCYLLRLFIKPMVFLTIIGVLLGMALGTYTLYQRSFEMRADVLYGTDNTFTVYADVTMGFFAFTAASLALYLLVLCCFWSSIFLAVGVIIESAKAMKSMPFLLFVPVIPALITFGIFCYWLIGNFYIASVGELKLDGNGFAQIEYDNQLKGMLAYHFFGFIWTTVFLNHVGACIISGAVAQWYFARDKSNDLGPSPILDSTKRTLWYHLGSIAFGSLIVAIVRYIRYMMNFLKRYADPENKYYGKFIKCIWCCIDCCLRCFERLLEFISKNAYILMTIESESFCTSARHAFGYLVSNLAGLAMVQTLGDLFLFLGKVFIAVVSAGICALILTQAPVYALETTSIVLPCIIVLIVAYLVGAMFMGIFEGTIDTIFMCYAIDEDKQLGYADGALKNFVKANAKETGTKDDQVQPAGSGSATDAG